MIGYAARWVGWLLLTVATGATVLWVAWAIQDSQAEEQAAKAAGFADAAELKSAKAAGISDSKAWQDRKSTLRAAEYERTRNPATKIEVTNQSWKIGGLGAVAIVSLTVWNQNDFPVKDLVITCSFSGNSGTHIGTAVHTLYETVKPKTKRTFADVNVGLIDSQSTRASCFIGLASRA